MDITALSVIYDFSTGYVASASKLLFKNSLLAQYCGEQFIDLWRDLYIGK